MKLRKLDNLFVSIYVQTIKYTRCLIYINTCLPLQYQAIINLLAKHIEPSYNHLFLDFPYIRPKIYHLLIQQKY